MTNTVNQSISFLKYTPIKAEGHPLPLKGCYPPVIKAKW
jgi:hypothetical protein